MRHGAGPRLTRRLAAPSIRAHGSFDGAGVVEGLVHRAGHIRVLGAAFAGCASTRAVHAPRALAPSRAATARRLSAVSGGACISCRAGRPPAGAVKAGAGAAARRAGRGLSAGPSTRRSVQATGTRAPPRARLRARASSGGSGSVASVSGAGRRQSGCAGERCESTQNDTAVTHDGPAFPWQSLHRTKRARHPGMSQARGHWRRSFHQSVKNAQG